ncbi:MAG TPA: aromatic ring-hydroxylating dioxygenase subunit alpha [Candidatus Eremiobacteraceae bacterium]|nr:aromatic ring-hydroxylating dioxygenase subunit alpha [Candidatus Eremiobacteraceae bacterium]
MKSTLERTLPRAYYFDEAIYERERERIFHREWFLACREEQVEKPGDYRTIDVAGENILIVRAKDGALHAHYNVCRHRGSRLVDEGSCGTFAGAIRCPYHSWTYEFDGALRTAPFLEESDGIRKGELNLHRVGTDAWGGFVFVNLSPGAAAAEGRTLAAQLDGVPQRLKRYPLAELRIAKTIVYDIDANWKVMLENYNECYHCAGVHPELCALVPDFKKRGGADLDWERGIPHREGAFTFTTSGTTDRDLFAGLDEDERTRHKGELIYPNFLLSLSADHVAAFAVFPRGPRTTQIVCDFLFHPDEMRKASFDPSDAVEFWDLTNRQDWRICESVQRGMGSRVWEYGYYAPMERWSLDLRRYVNERLG